MPTHVLESVNSAQTAISGDLIERPIDAEGLRELLDGFMMGDGAEQRDTFDFLRLGLDENRPDGCKLFP
jgi:hypothetical protein